MKPPTKGDEIWRDWFTVTESIKQPEIAPRSARIKARLPLGMAALASLAVIVAVVASRFVPAAGSAGARPSVPVGASATSPAPTGTPVDPLAAGFYLRAWRTQALAPQYTFAWLPLTTISNGQFIDGQVAVDAKYPGPAYIGPFTHSISVAGLEAVIAEARKDGLLDLVKEFGDDPLAGATLCHLEMTYGGKTSELTGACPQAAITGTPAAGSAEAYQSFWNRITDLSSWLGADLGAGKMFEPASVDVLVMPPTEPEAGVKPNEVAWPLTTTFATFGVEWGSGMRCATVTGADLEKLLPAVIPATALTRFVDSTGARMSLIVRPLMPGETSACS